MAPEEPAFSSRERREIRDALEERRIRQANRAQLMLILAGLGGAGAIATAWLGLWDKFFKSGAPPHP